MKHTPDCKWETTTKDECEFRETHHYCPHPEHTCNCNGQGLPNIPDEHVEKCAQVLVMSLIARGDIHKETIFRNFIISGQLFGNFKVTVEQIENDEK